MVVTIGIFILIFRILKNRDGQTDTTVFGNPRNIKQKKKVSKLPDKVISPSKQAEINRIQSDLDEGYGVDKE